MTIDAPRQKTRSGWGRRLARLGLISVAGFCVVVLFLVGSFWIGAGMRVELPDWIAKDVEARVNAQMPDTPMRLGGIDLVWQRDGTAEVVLNDTHIARSDGVGEVDVARLSFDVSLREVIGSGVSLKRVNLIGAAAVLRRDTRGDFQLGVGGGVSDAGNLGAIIDQIEAIFDRPELLQFSAIGLRDITVIVDDARAGRQWKVNQIAATLTRQQAGGLQGAAQAVVDGGVGNAPATLDLTFTSSGDDRSAHVSARVTNAASEEIALQTQALSFLGLIDVPLSGGIEVELDSQGEISNMSGDLRAGAGIVRPRADIAPLPFDGARVVFSFDPIADRLRLDQVSASAPQGRFQAHGHADFTDYDAKGFPQTLIAQIQVTDTEIAVAHFFAQPLELERAWLDVRVKRDPLTIEIGQVVIDDANRAAPQQPYRAFGRISAGPQGWSIDMDVTLERAQGLDALRVWPLVLGPKPRSFLAQAFQGGEIEDLHLAVRHPPGGGPPDMGLSFSFRDVTLRPLPDMPPIVQAQGYGSIHQERAVFSLASGKIVPPQSAPLQVGGSVLTIADRHQKPTPADLDLQIKGPIASVLRFVEGAPIKRTEISKGPLRDLTGQADLTVALDLMFGQKIRLDDIAYTVSGQLRAVESTNLVPNRRLLLDRATLRLTREAISVEGQGRLDDIALSGVWQGVPQPRQSSLFRGRARLSAQTLARFGVNLPAERISGQGWADLDLRLTPGSAPRLSLRSDLVGLALSEPSIGWRKSANEVGRLSIETRLGANPIIDRLEISGGGLDATGRITLQPDGALKALEFSRVKLGEWLDAQVTLRGRGRGRPLEINVAGGSIDIRRAQFAAPSNAAQSNGARAGRGPMQLSLDEVILSEGIRLTQARAVLAEGRALRGEFTARVNGGATVQGQVLPDTNGPRLRLVAPDAGAVLRDAGLFGKAIGGALDVTLVATGARGTYNGVLRVQNTRIRDAGTLAALLNAISVVGLVQQLSGAGIVFDDVSAQFQLSPSQITLYQSSAIGAAMGLSLDGTYDLAQRRLRMQGVVSPFYLINSIGSVFTRRGEGLVGVSFEINGPARAPQLVVNPLSILTPGMFREIFRRSPPKLPTN